MDDREILNLFLERSEQAIESLSGKYGPLCHHIAGNILESKSDAEECISDAYLAVWNTIPPEQPASLTAYLLGILRKLCYDRADYLSAEKRDHRLQLCLDELLGCIPDERAATALDSMLIRDTLNTFLRSLPKSDRYLFLRRYYYMDTCRQIAKQVGMTESAVSSRLNRLKAKLKERLEKEGIFV